MTADRLPPRVSPGSQYHNEAVVGPTLVKRQHYVPELFLRHFCSSVGVLDVYDTHSRVLMSTTPKNAAVITRLYDIGSFDGVRFSTEGWLSDIESEASAVLLQLVQEPGSVLTLSDGDESALARFLSAQLFRVPLFIDGLGLGMSTYMLAEVQGIANVLRALPWRVGATEGPFFYTCDNPMAGFTPSVRHWWDTSFLWSRTYHVPLSRAVALVIGKTLQSPKGPREHRDFTPWEASVTRHIVTSNASRYLYGPGPYVSADDAQATLGRINDAKLRDAVRLQGFDPSPVRPMSAGLTALLRSQDNTVPNIDGIRDILIDYLRGVAPLSALLAWFPEIEHLIDVAEPRLASSCKAFCLAVASTNAGAPETWLVNEWAIAIASLLLRQKVQQLLNEAPELYRPITETIASGLGIHQ